MTGKKIVEALRFVEVLHNGRISVNTKELMDAITAEVARLREALQSIANNTCCDGCQEAARVAKQALAALEGKV